MSGLGGAIAQARKQVARVDVYGRHGRVAVKRVAVVTRWEMLREGPPESWISLHDPEDEGKDFREFACQRRTSTQGPPIAAKLRDLVYAPTKDQGILPSDSKLPGVSSARATLVVGRGYMGCHSSFTLTPCGESVITTPAPSSRTGHRGNDVTAIDPAHPTRVLSGPVDIVGSARRQASLARE